MKHEPSFVDCMEVNAPRPKRYCADTIGWNSDVEATKAVRYQTMPVIVSNSERIKSQKSSGSAL